MLPDNLSDPFRDGELSARLAEGIRAAVQRPLRLMEVCGTHTMAIFRHGIRTLLPDAVELISGPGCPVCVTSAGDIDQIIELASMPGVILTTFGDLLRVPGSSGRNLAEARAGGAEVEIVYSPADALNRARNTDRTVVFPAIGFETTIPVIAATVLEARTEGINNFFLLVSHKVVPPALEVLLADPELAVDGLLCPGHVSAIIGARAYEPLAERYGMPCVVAGFEPLDILSAILLLVRQIRAGKGEVENAYGRVVGEDGNLRARQMIERVFEPCDARWRGLGEIPGSGLALRPEFREHDARAFFGLVPRSVPEPKGCRCGEILTGKVNPRQCPLFNTRCTPTHPVGPCMVSSEGTCAAYSRYGVR
ncbi:MAG: hydrogenase formation protein HypD [Desulfobulbaceae bacterium]|jgi:hydrogenase expression/formation protein HypD|nr:hydrogenase formation protein HypD [Desulfobulbaceae bacterium]MDY0350406.1 hydrogenase formation protein HypD [Desulfobulbaceae bacterium]